MKIREFYNKILNEEERAFLGKFLLVALCVQVAVMALTPVPWLLFALPVLPIYFLIDYSHGDMPEGLEFFAYTVCITWWMLFYAFIFAFKKKVIISTKILFSICFIVVYALLFLWMFNGAMSVHFSNSHIANYLVGSLRTSLSFVCLHLALYVFFCDMKLATRTIAFFVTYIAAVGAYWGVIFFFRQ